MESTEHFRLKSRTIIRKAPFHPSKVPEMVMVRVAYNSKVRAVLLKETTQLQASRKPPQLILNKPEQQSPQEFCWECLDMPGISESPLKQPGMFEIYSFPHLARNSTPLA